jgi:hypothetical protein
VRVAKFNEAADGVTLVLARTQVYGFHMRRNIQSTVIGTVRESHMMQHSRPISRPYSFQIAKRIIWWRSPVGKELVLAAVTLSRVLATESFATA